MSHSTGPMIADKQGITFTAVPVARFIIYPYVLIIAAGVAQCFVSLLLSNFNIRVNTRRDISSRNTLIASGEVGRIGSRKNIFHLPNDILFPVRGCFLQDPLCTTVNLPIFPKIISPDFISRLIMEIIIFIRGNAIECRSMHFNLPYRI